MVNWDKRFYNLAEYISNWSKDRSVGVCAIIVNKDHRIVSIGYNGFPSGCDDNKIGRHIRPAKYLYTEHGERNAIYNAAKLGVSLNGCAMYIYPLFPCADCARAIIQSGIDRIVSTRPDLENKNWGEHFKVALELFKETKVKIKYMRP